MAPSVSSNKTNGRIVSPGKMEGLTMKAWIMGGAALGLAVAGGAIAPDIDPDMKPMAGMYESDITLLSMNMPGVPANMVDMMRGMFERKTKFCITPEEVEEGFQQAPRKSQEGECSYDSFNAANGRIDAVLVCKGENGTMTMEMSGTGTPTSSDVTMEMSGDLGTGPGSMKMRVKQRRLGDC